MKWECVNCAGHVEEAKIYYPADRANLLLEVYEPVFLAAQELLAAFGLTNPFPNLEAAVTAAQEVRREILR